MWLSKLPRRPSRPGSWRPRRASYSAIAIPHFYGRRRRALLGGILWPTHRTFQTDTDSSSMHLKHSEHGKIERKRPVSGKNLLHNNRRIKELTLEMNHIAAISSTREHINLVETILNKVMCEIDELSPFHSKTAVLNFKRFVYNTMLKSCAKARKPQLSMKYLNRMINEGIIPKSKTVGKLIESTIGFHGVEREEMIDNILGLCSKHNLLNIVIYNMLISDEAKKGHFRRAAELLEIAAVEAEKGNIDPPDVVSYGAIINGYQRRGDLAMALKWMEKMIVAGVAPDSRVYCSIGQIYAMKGIEDQALYWLSKASAKFGPIHSRLLSTISNIHIKNKDIERAAELIEEEIKKGTTIEDRHIIDTIVMVYATLITEGGGAGRKRSNGNDNEDDGNLAQTSSSSSSTTTTTTSTNPAADQDEEGGSDDESSRSTGNAYILRRLEHWTNRGIRREVFFNPRTFKILIPALAHTGLLNVASDVIKQRLKLLPRFLPHVGKINADRFMSRGLRSTMTLSFIKHDDIDGFIVWLRFLSEDLRVFEKDSPRILARSIFTYIAEEKPEWMSNRVIDAVQIILCLGDSDVAELTRRKLAD